MQYLYFFFFVCVCVCGLSHTMPKTLHKTWLVAYMEHVCEQATNMMVNMPSSFSFKMVQTQLRTCSKHYDSPHEGTAGSYCRHVSREDLLLAVAATVVICGYRHKRRRHYWVRPSLRLGNEQRENVHTSSCPHTCSQPRNVHTAVSQNVWTSKRDMSNMNPNMAEAMF